MVGHSGAKHWWERDTTPGFILVTATIVSFLLLNSAYGEYIHHLLESQINGLSVGIGEGAHPLNLHVIINDALMVIFFLYVGLELKRETVEGPFKNPREAALPMAGALGGMIAPALIFVAFNAHEPAYLRGWAIPAATDIAFAIGVLSLLGPRVPGGLRLFLLALAIIDDLGAILVIAFFYSTHLVGWALGGAAVAFGVMLLMNRAGVKSLQPYWLLGLALWGFMLISGVHATIAGVLTAMTVPMRDKNGGSPLITAEHALKNWVQFAIMPIFALVNAGVALHGAGVVTLVHSITLGVALGLVFGKPLGIMLASYLACAVLKQRAPGTTLQMLGVTMLAGIGFTMSLFVGNLAFGSGDLATPVRFGVLGGSFVSAVLGLAVLSIACSKSSAIVSSELSAEEELAEQHGVLEDIDAPRPPKA
ncbi:Na+/H+ antiporter NhaA [Candidatus Viadribacter manganicus]|uniref:Na+/H+ antiporter NhaA n=1 Tax=Candidatus Viadribacter manganicus TaxID=1759059 RepID=UPI000832D2BF|nr:Na+/H+ antiporter NhaA [Candidatus Viadribacter manganicus]